MNNDVLALVPGGGQGTRLLPLTQHRSKSAVLIGGKYRLIDIPVSNLPGTPTSGASSS
jgi:glucose-1-phosphate adenylyltransferase